MYRLPSPKLANCEAALPTSPGPSCLRGTPWSTHFFQAGPAEHLQLVRIRKGNKWKTAFHHTIRPLRVPGDAVWPSQLTVSLPVFYERGVLGVPPSVCNSLHWLHPIYSRNLAEHRPPHDAGPPAAQRTPPLSEVGKMRVPLLHGAVPQICHQSWKYQMDPGKVQQSSSGLFRSREGTPTISRICQLL